MSLRWGYNMGYDEEREESVCITAVSEGSYPPAVTASCQAPRGQESQHRLAPWGQSKEVSKDSRNTLLL